MTAETTEIVYMARCGALENIKLRTYCMFPLGHPGPHWRLDGARPLIWTGDKTGIILADKENPA